MDTTTAALTIHLPAGSARTLPVLRDAVLIVLQGRVWLTRSGDADDHWLDAGQRLALGGSARVVVEAERDGARCLLVAAEALPAERALRQSAPFAQRR